MKQCPSCNRTYANDKQKFCTQDGTSLVDAHSANAGQGETVRIDSQQLDAEVTKVISQELPRMSGSVFDPYKTVVSTPQSTTPAAPPSRPVVNPPTAPPSAPEPSATAPDKTTPVPVQPSAVAPPTAPLSAAPPVTTTPVTASPPAATPPPATPPAAESSAEPPAATPLPPTPPQDSSAQAAPASSSAAGEAGQVTMPPPSVAGEAGQVTMPPPSVQAAAAAAAAQPVQPRRKKSKLPLILGILFVLLLLGAGGAVAGYFFVLRPMLEKKHIAGLEPRRPRASPNVASTPDVENKTPETPKVEVPPYSPPANAVQFVNSNKKLTGKLAEHYVDFSFYYPKGWQKDPQAGVPGATNFVQVERRLPPNYTLENFAVGWYGSAGSAELDRTVFPRLVENLSSKFEKTIDNYRKVSEHETKIGPYDAYEFRFEGLSQMTDKGQFKIWGVAVFVPPIDGGKDGVTLLMLATSLAPDLKSINDVGAKGELPMMLDSFRFGK